MWEPKVNFDDDEASHEEISVSASSRCVTL